VGGGSFEEAHERSLSERLTEEPPPWLSPDLTAWAAGGPWLRTDALHALGPVGRTVAGRWGGFACGA
jgi:hypothetical protein